MMNIDGIQRQVTVTRAEIKNHQNYLKVKSFMEKGYGVIVSDPPVVRPLNRLTLTRDEARNTQTYEAAKAKAVEQGRHLWIEDPRAEARGLE
jgi:hypothetical protein